MVADGQASNFSTDLAHNAGAFVAADQRESCHCDIADWEMVVRMAQPGRDHLHQDFGWTWIVDFDRLHFPLAWLLP
jgi:hypothetical protein